MGAAGLTLIVLSTFYKVRKGWLRFLLFTLQDWLYAHVIVGILALYLVIAHSGFHLQNTVAALALLFLAITVVSGVAGMFIFYFLPRSQARHEVAVLIPQDLCRRISKIHDEISELCTQKGGVFLELYNELVIPLYRTEVGKQPPSVDVTPWADKMPAGEEESFMALAVKIEEAHDLFVLLGKNMRFRWWIRGWLLLHIPATLGLVVFTVAHLISMAWYRMP